MDHILLDCDYVEQWRRYSNLRPSSLSSYICCLQEFEHFLLLKKFSGALDFNNFFYYSDDNIFLPLNEAFINEYFRYLKEECNTSRSTMYMNVSALKNFFTFLKDIQLIIRLVH
ncbi:hypothetical protein D3C73_671330 [compost metagenome]